MSRLCHTTFQRRESHTGNNIVELLKTALKEWDITGKDPVIITDDASNMTIAAQLAGMLHVKCFMHTIKSTESPISRTHAGKSETHN